MTRRTNSAVLDGFEDDLRAELGRHRSLGQLIAAAPGLADVIAHKPDAAPVSVSAPFRALVTETGGGGDLPSFARPSSIASAPLLSAVTVVDDIVEGNVQPFTVAMTSAADVVDTGDPTDEASLTYTAGEVESLEYIGHHITMTTRQARRPTLRADVDTFLAGGVLAKVEDRLAAVLTAATGTVAHAFDTDIATTIRTGIAAAQSAFRELGPGEVFVALSPLDHAALDLDDLDLSEWPARIVSSPALVDGTAYIGRLKLAVFLYTTEARASVTTGHINDQYIRNKLTALAGVEALAHVSAPSAIVKAELADGS